MAQAEQNPFDQAHFSFQLPCETAKKKEREEWGRGNKCGKTSVSGALSEHEEATRTTHERVLICNPPPPLAYLWPRGVGVCV